MRYRDLLYAKKISRRVFRKYYRVFPEHFNESYPNWNQEEWMQAMLGKFRKTRVFCSRFCCGNQRRHAGSKKESLTIQERKAPDIYEEF